MPRKMCNPAIGAKVTYCGHDGWFVADLIRVGNTMVVRANGKVTPGNIVRGRSEEATHHLTDVPGPLFWCPERGIFVVPNDGHVYELGPERHP